MYVIRLHNFVPLNSCLKKTIVQFVFLLLISKITIQTFAIPVYCITI